VRARGARPDQRIAGGGLPGDGRVHPGRRADDEASGGTGVICAGRPESGARRCQPGGMTTLDSPHGLDSALAPVHMSHPRAHGPDIDIWTEPDGDPHTLAQLGPLAPLAGTWSGRHGVDVHPVEEGANTEDYTERIDNAPIDFQTNGPQLLYGLRYHQFVLRPAARETFHDQVGYWLWEPATSTVFFSLTIPRGQAVLASGLVAPDATSFTVRAERGSTTNGIVSNPFLDQYYLTTSFAMTVHVGDDGTWTYDQTTTLLIPGREPFQHTDSSVLTRIGPPAPNNLIAG
jgi:hypothetical protein